MIANQTLGRGFVGLGSYLLTGRDRVDPSQRVGWIEHRNLPTERLDVAIRIMAGTASLSYTKRPVFHLSVSFAPGDPVDAALMKRVMVRTLSDLGLGEHQAVMVAHVDTDDPHVHARVNRVHPETGVAWKGSWSRLRVEASLRQQELGEGLRVVPGWLARAGLPGPAERASAIPGREDAQADAPASGGGEGRVTQICTGVIPLGGEKRKALQRNRCRAFTYDSRDGRI